MGNRRRFGRDVHLNVPPAIYTQIESLARESRRTVTAQINLALEAYLERAIQGSQRHAELVGEPGWMREAQKEEK